MKYVSVMRWNCGCTCSCSMPPWELWTVQEHVSPHNQGIVFLKTLNQNVGWRQHAIDSLVGERSDFVNHSKLNMLVFVSAGFAWVCAHGRPEAKMHPTGVKTVFFQFHVSYHGYTVRLFEQTLQKYAESFLWQHATLKEINSLFTHSLHMSCLCMWGRSYHFR